MLIHGNGGSIAYMQPQIEYFAEKYQVVVMDCRGRGKSEPGGDMFYQTVANYFDEPYRGEELRK